MTVLAQNASYLPAVSMADAFIEVLIAAAIILGPFVIYTLVRKRRARHVSDGREHWRDHP